MFHRGLLALLIVYMPNALHLHLEIGIPGVNLANLLILMAVIGLVLNGHDSALPAPGRGRLTVALIGWFLAITYGFVIAQLAQPIDLLADATYLKNAITYPLLYFIFRRCHEDRNGTRQLIILVMIVAVVAGLEAVREGLDYGIAKYSETRRAAGPFGTDYRSANRAGVFYAMFLPMFVALALFLRKQRLWRLAAVGASVLLAFAIMVTFSRQSYLIAIISVFILLFRRSVIVSALSAVLLFSSLALLPNSVTQRVAETEQQSTAGVGELELDTSTASRPEIWGGAAQMWSEHPLGVGINRFPVYIGNYSRYAGYDAHNFYVLTMAEIGPIGLLALMWLLWRLWRLATAIRVSAKQTRDAETIALALGFSVSIAAMALGNLFGSPFLEGSVMANFWILCGLLERYAALSTTRNVDDNAPVAVPIGKRFPLAARALPSRYRNPARDT